MGLGKGGLRLKIWPFWKLILDFWSVNRFLETSLDGILLCPPNLLFSDTYETAAANSFEVSLGAEPTSEEES